MRSTAGGALWMVGTIAVVAALASSEALASPTTTDSGGPAQASYVDHAEGDGALGWEAFKQSTYAPSADRSRNQNVTDQTRFSFWLLDTEWRDILCLDTSLGCGGVYASAITEAGNKRDISGCSKYTLNCPMDSQMWEFHVGQSSVYLGATPTLSGSVKRFFDHGAQGRTFDGVMSVVFSAGSTGAAEASVNVETVYSLSFSGGERLSVLQGSGGPTVAANTDIKVQCHVPEIVFRYAWDEPGSPNETNRVIAEPIDFEGSWVLLHDLPE